jgi:hypothetical protein
MKTIYLTTLFFLFTAAVSFAQKLAFVDTDYILKIFQSIHRHKKTWMISRRAGKRTSIPSMLKSTSCIKLTRPNRYS